MATTTEAPTQAPGSNAHKDPAASFVPVQIRSGRPRSFEPDDFGRPGGREVNWIHTPLDRLGPVLDTEAESGAIDLDVSVPTGTLRADEAPRGEVFTPEDLPGAIAWQRAAEATHIVVDGENDTPVTVDVTGTGALAHQNLVIEARQHARGVVLLRHSGPAQLAQNVEIIVRDGAHLTVVSLQRWDDETIHAANHQARVDRDATLRHFVVSFGGSVVRVNPSVELAGAGSRGELYGLCFSDSGQHLESQVFLYHKGPETSGDVLYKGALQGASARTVWIGDVLIGADATGTDSYEANRNLVLTDVARAESIPNLEIETGDIRGAGHASATGRFDDEQLFYLQSRGVPEAEARRLVVLGFLSEIAQRIGVPALEEEFIAAIESELEIGAAA